VDGALLSAISALAGTAIGAISSFGSTWMSAKAQSRAARLAAERAKREDIYARFMDELARLYADALNNVGVDNDRLTAAYALNGRIALYASTPVNDAAEEALRYIVDLALGPKRSPAEVRALMDQPEANVMRTFAERCRVELHALGG
jgi:hypothetical protein